MGTPSWKFSLSTETSCAQRAGCQRLRFPHPSPLLSHCARTSTPSLKTDTPVSSKPVGANVPSPGWKVSVTGLVSVALVRLPRLLLPPELVWTLPPTPNTLVSNRLLGVNVLSHGWTDGVLLLVASAPALPLPSLPPPLLAAALMLPLTLSTLAPNRLLGASVLKPGWTDGVFLLAASALDLPLPPPLPSPAPPLPSPPLLPLNSPLARCEPPL